MVLDPPNVFGGWSGGRGHNRGRGRGNRGRGRGRGRGRSGGGGGLFPRDDANRTGPIAVLDPFAPSDQNPEAANNSPFGATFQQDGERSSFGTFGQQSSFQAFRLSSVFPLQAPIEVGDPFASGSMDGAAGHSQPTRPEPVFTVFGSESSPNYDDFVGRSEPLSSPSTRVKKRLDEEAEELQRKIKMLEDKKHIDQARRQKSETDKERGVRMKELRMKALAGKKPVPNSREELQIVRSNGASSRKRSRVNIEDAVSIVGTCPTMCPRQEMEDREVQRNLSIFERFPGEAYAVDPERAVKKYRRSAALAEEPSPEEIRPSPVLAKTMDYLKKLCDSTAEPYFVLHSFVRDRTRSIRQDFTFQGIRDATYVRILEECVRFHIMTEHKLYGSSPEVFSSKQNLEQLDKCLITLRQIYEERRKVNLLTSVHESEMQAYYLLLHLFHPKTRVQVYSGLSRDVLMSAEVQRAHCVSEAVSSSFVNFVGFFRIVKEAPYLFACALHRYFGKIRTLAAMVIGKAYSISNKDTCIPVDEFMEWLGFDSEDELESFCHCFDWPIIDPAQTNGKLKAKSVLVRKTEGISCTSWAKGERIIEAKCEGQPLSKIISGLEAEIAFTIPSPGHVPESATEPVASPELTSNPASLLQDQAPPTTLSPTPSAIGVSRTPERTAPFGSPREGPVTAPIFLAEQKDPISSEPASAFTGSSTSKRKRVSIFEPADASAFVSASVTPRKALPGSSKRPRTFTTPIDADDFAPASRASLPDAPSVSMPFHNPIPAKGVAPDCVGNSEPVAVSHVGTATSIVVSNDYSINETAEASDVVEKEPEEDAELKKEREDDKIAFDQLVLFENEFKEIACTPHRTLDFVEVEMRTLPSWKQDPPGAYTKVVHLCSIVETIASGLKELKRKTGDVKPVFADTEEKQDWIIADCVDDLEFANKLWHKLRMFRRSISIRLLRAGISIRAT